LCYSIGHRYCSMDMCPLWDAFLLRVIGVHRVQSAGETESEPPGYQTETRSISAGLGRWDWPRGRATIPDISGSVLSDAGAAQRLRTSPPTDHRVSIITKFWFYIYGPLYTGCAINQDVYFGDRWQNHLTQIFAQLLPPSPVHPVSICCTYVKLEVM
jgi:hypothetical protein